MMQRKQIYLDQQCAQRLKVLAMRKRRSEASLIREAVDQLLAADDRLHPGDEDNPLLQLLGVAPHGRPDGALHHDRFLYGTDP